MRCSGDFTLGRPRCISPFSILSETVARQKEGMEGGRVGPPHTAHTGQRSMGDESGTRMRDADEHRTAGCMGNPVFVAEERNSFA